MRTMDGRHGFNWRLRELWSKLGRALLLRRGLDADLRDEMQSHLALLMDDKIEQGLSQDEALAAARRHFGNEFATLERAREAWQFPRLETWWQDVRYALR